MKLKTFPAPLILFLALLFSFTAYSAVDVWRSNQEIKLPEQFLGYWRPYSRDLYVGIEFTSDGVYKKVLDKNKQESISTGYYKVVKIDKKNRAYLFIYEEEQISQKSNLTYYILEESPHCCGGKLLFLYEPFIFSWKLTEKDWNSSKLKQWQILQSEIKDQGKQCCEQGIPFSFYSRVSYSQDQ